MFWLKVRTPAALKDLRLGVFRRLSLRTNSPSEARCAARTVRAALDAGFALAGAGMRAGVFSEGEAEAVIAALARVALARAESLRALSGPRSEEAVLAAKRAHLAAREVWIDILRRNDLAAVAPGVVEAASLAGLTASEEALGPDLLRDAARTLVAVCEENVAREDGLFAGDHARLLARLASAGTTSDAGRAGAGRAAPTLAVATRTEPNAGARSARGSSPVRGATACAPRPDVAVEPVGPVLVWNASEPEARSPAPATGRDLPASSRPAGIEGAGRVLEAASDADGSVEDSAIDRPRASDAARAERLPAFDASGRSGRRAPEPIGGPSCDGRAVAALPPAVARSGRSDKASAVRKPVASASRRVAKTPSGKIVSGTYTARRRSAPDPAVTAIRRRSPEELWNMTLEEGFALTKAKASNSGTNEAWIRGSERGFDASGRLAMAYFGPGVRLRDITPGECQTYVDHLGLVPNKWNSGGKHRLEETRDARVSLEALIDSANVREDAALSAVEERAEAENWSQERFQGAAMEAREPRLAPATQYKHQSYFSAVFKTVIEAAGSGSNPMRLAIWTRKEKIKRIAEGGVTRVALGVEGRAALFSRPLFVQGPEIADDPMFWAPLIARYQGLRMEEACQLKLADVGEVEGIAVLHIRASDDQQLKSITSARDLPIHPELVRLGILRLAVEKRRAGAKWLLDVERHRDGTFSSRYSKAYHNWRRAEGIYEPGKDFHSLRKDFYQDLKRARVDYAARTVLLGHALNDVSETHYGHREWLMSEMRDFVHAIPADTTHIRPVR